MKAKFCVLLFIAFFLSMSAAAAMYDIYIAGVQVTDANKNDVLGDGKIRFQPSATEDFGQIRFYNVQRNAADTFLIIGEYAPQNVDLYFYGNNRIFSESGYSFICHNGKEICFLGNSLTTDGMLLYNVETVNIEMTDIKAYGRDKNGWWTGIVGVNIKNRLGIASNIRQSYIAGFPEIQCFFSRLTTEGVTYNTMTQHFENARGKLITQVDFAKYELYGEYTDKDHQRLDNTLIEIATYNCSDPLGDETLSYDSITGEFALHNLCESSAILEIRKSSITEPDYCVIHVNGENNMLHMMKIDSYTAKTYGLHIKGPGTLRLVSENSLSYLSADGNKIRLSDGCKVIVDGRISCSAPGMLWIENSSLTINRQEKDYNKLLGSFKEVILSNCQVVYPEGAVWDSNLKAFTLNGVEVTDRIEIAPVNTAIDGVNADTPNDPAYDLLGRPVDANYRGIVIQGGKKMVQ